jgi:hypothetical protein
MAYGAALKAGVEACFAARDVRAVRGRWKNCIEAILVVLSLFFILV